MLLSHLRYLTIVTLLLLHISSVTANGFVKFATQTYTIGEKLPTLDTLCYVGHGTTPQVSLYYPEYAELTKEEVRLIKRYKHTLTERPLVTTEMGTSRGRALVNVSITPFIKRGSKHYRLLSAKLLVATTPDASASARTLHSLRSGDITGRYKNHSVLATGKWVKIRVNDTGIHQLTPNDLKAMGFATLNNVRIFGYGGKWQNEVINYTTSPIDIDDLEEIPTYNTGSKLLFFAQGPYSWTPWNYDSSLQLYTSARTQNPYSSYGYYFVTEGSPMAFPEVTALATPTNTITTFPERAHYEQDAFAWLQSGSQLYDPYDFATGASKTFHVATPDAVASKSLIRLSHTVAHSSSTQTAVTLDGTALGRFTTPALYDEYYMAQVGNANYTTTNALASVSKIGLTMPVGTTAHLDYITINYERQLTLSGHNALLFSHYLTSPTDFHISGASSETQVWRIGVGSGDATARMNTSLLGNTLSVPIDLPSRAYIAFNTSGQFPTPEVVGTIENQDLHAHTATDMVIIVPENAWTMPQAERLAELHRKKDNLRVRIVRADQLYNEFSSGTPDAMAYRRYLKMLYDRAEREEDMPKYLLLFGPSLWDNRLLTPSNKALSAKDYLLCYESTNSTHKVNSYVSDDFFGFLDDGEGNMRSSKLDIAIGRISPKTMDEATTAVDKIIAYSTNTQVGSWKNLITMMADDGDYNRHMNDAETVAREITSRDPNYIVDKVFWDAYTIESSATGKRYPEITSYLRNVMQNGALVMNYTGHGSPSLVSHEQVLTIRDFRTSAQNRLPYWAFAACEVTPFDGTTDYISAAALFNKTAGAIAIYGSTRDVYASQNFALNRQMMRYLLDKDSVGRTTPMGEAVRLAKNAMSTEDNKLKYVLFGDPALRLAAPAQRIIIDSINGQPLTLNTLQLKAGSVLTLSGYLANYTDSTILHNFNGSITASLYDRMRTITGRKNNTATTTPIIFQAYKDLLFEGSDSVRQGRFTLSIPIPIDISYSSDLGKLFLYAVNEIQSSEAHGHWNNFYLDGTADSMLNDSIGPNVKVHLDTPYFINGGYTGTMPSFIAHVSDQDGINTTGLGIGHDIELVVDNDATKTYVLNDYFRYDFGSYTSGQLRFTLPELTPGEHQLRFRVWDLKNNATTQYLNFIVDPSASANTTLTVTPNLATTLTQMSVRHSGSEPMNSVTVQVFDIAGRLCMEETATSLTGTTSYIHTWDLTTNSGSPLPSGVYICRASVTTQSGKHHTNSQKLVITRP